MSPLLGLKYEGREWDFITVDMRREETLDESGAATEAESTLIGPLGALKEDVEGVSGCGKSTIGAALAARLRGATFFDGDDFHPQSNVEKMAAGIPLTDEDRAPWLARIRASAVTITKQHTGADEEKDHDSTAEQHAIFVVACSALKKQYRDVLRGAEDHPAVASEPEPYAGLDHTVEEDKDVKPLAPHAALLATFFVFLDGPEATLFARMASRKGHYMKDTMLRSQLETLERPNEGDVVTIDLEKTTDEQIDDALAGMKKLGMRFDIVNS